MIKSHAMPTVGRAAGVNEMCREQYGDSTDFKMYGGVTKIIISHPESNLVGLTLEEQKRLARD